MATINPNQQYDIIHTLTFSAASGTCPIRLYRGSPFPVSGTVYYRAGTSGGWTTLSVSGTSTTFPVTSLTMQIAHNWNKSDNNYMMPSFRGATNITSIAISQKSALTGAVGNYFMYYYAYGCSSLTSLAVPDTSGLESVGNYFMYCYARNCSSLTELVLPAVGWFENHNVNWSVPSGRLGVLKGHVLNSDDLSDWKALTAEGKTLYTNYIRDPDLVYYEEATEYVADLIRTIIQTQSYNADTKRPITQSQTYQADTLQQVVKSYGYTVDAIRQVIQSQGYNADTKRQIAKEFRFNADTTRRIAKEYSYPADAERKILQDYDYAADTFRKVLKVYQYPADMVRKIVKEYEHIADTLRHVIMPYTQLIITMSIQERQIDLSTQEREVKLGVEQMSLIGNTVRLKAEFKDFNGEHVSPENVNLRIYDGYKKQVGEDIPVLPSDVGKYQYDYVIPGDVIGPLYFEFVGTIGELPILGRATIDRRWI